jgi:hypothetical protein
MKINYTITQAEKDKLAAANPRTLTNMTLRYWHTDGIVTLSCTEREEPLELHVPVLDLALCWRYILEKLQTEHSVVFNFTDSHWIITFCRLEELVVITTDFCEWRCQTPYKQLKASVEEFAQAVLDDLCGSVPELQANPTVIEAYKKLARSVVQEQGKGPRE